MNTALAIAVIAVAVVAVAAIAALAASMAKAKDAAIREFVAEKEKSFEKSTALLREQFANLAAQTLKDQSGDLAKLNVERLDAALKPLREQVRQLQEAAQKASAERATFKQSMAENIGAISGIAGELARTADALTSNTRVQGRKGEDILAEKLRQAGLEENVSFFLQDGTDTDRPDAQVCDTENRWLVIDSKVSLTAYMEYAEAKSPETRKNRLDAHVASVRQKIDQLARRKYPAVLAAKHPERTYLPVTAMFVPYEAPLAEALKADASLLQFAAQNNIVLVTPLTLMAWLRLVYMAWQRDREERNQEEIVKTARELLARTNSFLVEFEKIGKAISSLQDTYDGAKALIADSPRSHSIAKAANKLIELHVKLENRKGRKLETAECLANAGVQEG